MSSELTEVTMKATAAAVAAVGRVFEDEAVSDDVSMLRVFERVASAMIAEADSLGEYIRQSLDAR